MPLDPDRARGQLAAATRTGMLLRPDILHVVGHTEAHHITGPDELIASCTLVHQVIDDALLGLPDPLADPRVAARRDHLVEEASFLLAAIEERFPGAAAGDPAALAGAVRARLPGRPVPGGDPGRPGGRGHRGRRGLRRRGPGLRAGCWRSGSGWRRWSRASPRRRRALPPRSRPRGSANRRSGAGRPGAGRGTGRYSAGERSARSGRSRGRDLSCPHASGTLPNRPFGVLLVCLQEEADDVARSGCRRRAPRITSRWPGSPGGPRSGKWTR